jgi:hypothetical protein
MRGHDPNGLVHNYYNGGQLPSIQFPILFTKHWRDTHVKGCHPSFFLHYCWLCNDHNSSDKTTTNNALQLWKPSSGIFMTNDPEEAVSCTTLLKINKKVLMLCMFLAGKEIEQVEDFISILSKLSPGAGALLEFVTPEDRHHTISVVVNVGRHE